MQYTLSEDECDFIVERNVDSILIERYKGQSKVANNDELKF
jgi:hypothetical protein